ncbi:thiol reductase thioredoxin [Saccharibacter sp. 17.LH.SD]|uniref:thioredoxin family protein n=1 Tax=Saccharibacter sp. 17.LH.SD TaxID=2689393 RepID=UPI001371D909|nr:thioredoxin family protein [Saccharibacter sp. 17.LH.SD]MXV44722.1 thiol reductase thioredoxin [Saccharibacter sp. 17.LH.SD]
MRSLRLLALAATTLFLAPNAHASSTPATSPYSSPTPAPHLQETSSPPVNAPYPDAGLAPVQVKEAFITAAKTHRRVLLDFGGNWCPDCRMLAGVFSLPDAASWLEQNFVIVPINVERFNKNMGIAAQYGVTIKAVPTVLILTPEGNLLNGNDAAALGNARRMSPQATIDLLAKWNDRSVSSSQP